MSFRFAMHSGIFYQPSTIPALLHSGSVWLLQRCSILLTWAAALVWWVFCSRPAGMMHATLANTRHRGSPELL